MAHLLVTIPFSHYCEKARWALDRARIPYVEDPHPPILHIPYARRAGGTRSVPVLQTSDGCVHADSTDILRFADAQLSEETRLYPAELADEAAALEDLFDTKLGPHTRRLGYFYLLPRIDLLSEVLRQRSPAWESWFVLKTRALGIPLMRRGMRIDAEGAARSLQAIEGLFAQVDAKLADGRRTLLGTRFTAADLTLAALAAPVIMPPELPVPFPALERLPAPFRDVVTRLRASPTGALVLRLYREERR